MSEFYRGKIGDVHEIITFSGPTKPRSYPWAEKNNPFLILRQHI
jgi:hypothetical protein